MALPWYRRRKLGNTSNDVSAEEDPEVYLRRPRHFSLHELQLATNDFSHRNKLDDGGGYGTVFKGRLADGTLVAVKRFLCKRNPHAVHEFHTAREMTTMAVHRNLLNLRGFYTGKRERRILVYSYMANGSLASCLRARLDNQPPLNWSIRKRIALGSAKGIAYLHDHCHPKIIHRDVKASSILLDEEFEPVVGNFRVAIHLDHKDTHDTINLAGTIGHIAPECFLSEEVTEKVDVYGYGTMLLELITGQRVFDLTVVANEDNLTMRDWVKKFMEDGQLEKLVDVNMESNYSKTEVDQMLKIALVCLQDSPMQRPNMSDIVYLLEGYGLAEKWKEWQKGEMSCSNISNLNF